MTPPTIAAFVPGPAVPVVNFGAGVFCDCIELVSGAPAETWQETGPRTSVTFGSGGDGFGHAIDGDADEAFWLFIRFAANPVAVINTLEMRFNGITTNRRDVELSGTTSGALTNSAGSNTRIILPGSTTQSLALDGKYWMHKLYEGVGAGHRMGSLMSGGAANTTMMQGAIWWENSTNITSIDIVAPVANGIGNGTVLSLWCWKVII